LEPSDRGCSEPNNRSGGPDRMTRDRILRMVLAAFALAATNSAEKPRQQAGPANSREAEEDYRRAVGAANGDGVPQDYATAARYYRKAAERGYVPAQYGLACLYENGLGVKKDFEQAAVWYRKAAEQGDAESQNHCCPKQDRLVAPSAEKRRFGVRIRGVSGGGLQSGLSRPVQIIRAPV